MSKAQIMIVEDDGVVTKDIQKRLKNLGFAVSSIVPSGAGAIRKAKEDTPDLVLMDIVLKGEMDGIDAANQIYTQFNIPVVYLTAYADEKHLERAKVTEPFGYIIKPFEERELNIAIEIALYKHTMEKRLKESEQWLSTTLRSIGDAVIATDKHGHVKLMNPIAQSLTGFNQEEAMGKPLKDVFDIINEETGKQVKNPVARVIREGIVVGLANHTVLISKDGTEIPIDDSGAPIRDEKGDIIGVVLVFHDIRERKMAEKALRESEAQKKGILDASIDRIRLVDKDMRIIWANKTTTKELNITPEDLAGQHCYKAFVGRDSPCPECTTKKALETGNIEHAVMHQTKSKGIQEETYWDAYTVPIKNESGDIANLIQVARNITDKVKAEEEQKKLESQFQQAQRMESIGTLAGGIAHNFNNVLMGIQGNTSLILLGKTSDHPDYERLTNIEQGVLLLRQLNMSILCGINNLWMPEVTTNVCRPFDESPHK